jgi:glyoxylase I family protein
MDEDRRESQKQNKSNTPGLLSVAYQKETAEPRTKPLVIHGMHHVGLLCENLERSLEFYRDVLGLEINPDRPDDKLPYRGAWLWVGSEMIHLMELPNPDPLDGRPEHGGRDRHFCVGIQDMSKLQERLDKAGIVYTMSMSGRRAVFFRDPDMNCLEFVEMEEWR